MQCKSISHLCCVTASGINTSSVACWANHAGFRCFSGCWLPLRGLMGLQWDSLFFDCHCACCDWQPCVVYNSSCCSISYGVIYCHRCCLKSLASSAVCTLRRVDLSVSAALSWEFLNSCSRCVGVSSQTSGALSRPSARRSVGFIQYHSDHCQSGGEALQRHLADHRHPGETLRPWRVQQQLGVKPINTSVCRGKNKLLGRQSFSKADSGHLISEWRRWKLIELQWYLSLCKLLLSPAHVTPSTTASDWVCNVH